MKKLLSAVLFFSLAGFVTALPCFAQQSANVNSTWNGGTGPWFSAGNWTTSGVVGQAIPNNGNTVICNIDQQCRGIFNVAVASGGNDLVTLDSTPVTIDALDLGGITGNSSLVIGSPSSDTLTIGDIGAPVSAAAELNVSAQGVLTVNSSSSLSLNIAAADGKAINNGAIDLNGVDGASLLINDAGNAHSLTLSGIGAINLQSGSAIEGVSGDELLVNNSTIQGSGLIPNLSVVNGGNLISAGSGGGGLLIKATVNQSALGSFAANSFGLLNTGAISANKPLQIDTTLSQPANIASVINFGTIAVSDSSLLNFVGQANSLVSLINSARGGAGTIHIGGSGAGGSLLFTGANTTFDLNDGGAINSGVPAAGSLVLSDNAKNQILGVNGSETLVIDGNETLSGAGTIETLSLVNNGTIIANGANQLIVKPNVNSSAVGSVAAGSFGFLNEGTVQVSPRSALWLDTTASQAAGIAPIVNFGKIAVGDGGQIEVFGTPGNTVSLVNAAVSGGAGAMTLGGSGRTTTMLLDGANTTFDLNDGGRTLNGLPVPGTLTLSDSAFNFIAGIQMSETLVNDVGEALSGAGTIEALSLVNNGTIIANGTNHLVITPNANGFRNAGMVTVNPGSTLVVNLTNTTAGTGFSNSGTVNVKDGAALSMLDLIPGSTATINNFEGAINVGQSSGARLLLEDNGAGATFDLMAGNGVSGAGKLTLVNSTIAGVAGDETLVNDFANTIEGTGSISNLTFTNNSTVAANGGTLAINAKLTNLAGGTLTGGTFEAGDASSGILQLPGDVTTNSAFVLLVGSGSAVTDPAGKNALAGVSENVNGGNIAIDNGASLTINSNLTNGAPLSPSGIIQLHGGGSLTINGNLTNWDQIETGPTEGPVAGADTITVSGAVINNFRAGDVEDFIEVNGSGDALNVGSFQNAALVIVGNGAKLNSSGGYVQSGGNTDVNGTLMAASITATGGIVESGGGIVETQSLANGATIAADSAGFIGVGKGDFTATTGYQQLGNGTLAELISSSTSFGTITVAGPASLDGTLDVTLENGFVPTLGEQFAFLDFTPGDLQGAFASFLDQTFDNGLEKWTLNYNNAGGDVLLTAETNTASQTPEPASLLLLGTGLLGMALVAGKRWTSVRGVPKL